MSPRRRSSLTLLFSVILLSGCEGDQPFGPAAAEPEPSFARETAATLAAPSNVTAAALSASQIEVRWQDNSTGESRFEIHRSSGGPAGAYSLVTSTGSDVTIYRNDGLQSTAQYCYMVRAVKSTGKKVTLSPFSNIGCAPTFPAPAQDVKVIPSGGGSIVISWKAIGLYFRIEKSTDSGASWSVAGTVYNSTIFVAEAQAEQLTCLRVINFNESGEAAPSNSACATLPAAPTGFSVAAANPETLALTWTDNSNVEDAYEVWFMMDQWSCGDGHSGVFNYETRLAILPANATSYQTPGVLGEDACALTSWYEVRSIKDGSYSGASFVIDP